MKNTGSVFLEIHLKIYEWYNFLYDLIYFTWSCSDLHLQIWNQMGLKSWNRSWMSHFVPVLLYFFRHSIIFTIIHHSFISKIIVIWEFLFVPWHNSVGFHHIISPLFWYLSVNEWIILIFPHRCPSIFWFCSLLFAIYSKWCNILSILFFLIQFIFYIVQETSLNWRSCNSRRC